MSRSAPPVLAARRRLTLLDLVLFAGLAGFVVFAVYRVDAVLEYRWDWQPVFNFVFRRDPDGNLVSNLLVQGLLTTLRLAIWGTIFAGIIGVVMGFWRTSELLALRILSRSYVELIRNIPPLVFIFIFYFFIASQIFPALGLEDINPAHPYVDNPLFRFAFGDPKLLSNFLAGLICLALFEAAYITEIVRAGIQSVPKGQWEAARAIGLSRFNVLRDIILPQAIRKILPPLAGQFISLIKDSAIVSLISVQELTFMASEVATSTSRVFETWILVAALYFGLCYSFSLLFSRAERRARRSLRKS